MSSNRIKSSLADSPHIVLPAITTTSPENNDEDVEELKKDIKRAFHLKSEDDPELPDYIDAGAMAARRFVSSSTGRVRINENAKIFIKYCRVIAKALCRILH